MTGTRRAALLALPAVLVAGCGGDGATAPVSTGRRDDVALLARFLKADNDASHVWVNGMADPAARLLRDAMTRETERHFRSVMAAIGRLGGPRPAVLQELDLTGFTLRQALIEQERMVRLLLDITPRIADDEARRLCAGILADKAARIAQLRIAAGQDAVPRAFVT